MESTLYGERKRDFQKLVFFLSIYVRADTQTIKKKKEGKYPIWVNKTLPKRLFIVFLSYLRTKNAETLAKKKKHEETV